jgi:hypothetical protein
MRSGRRHEPVFIQPKAGAWGWACAAALLVLVGGTLWWLLFGPGGGGPSHDSADQSGNAVSGEELTIWFASRQEDALVAEKRRMPPTLTSVGRAKASLQELIAGPKGDALRTISAEVNIRELFIDNQGTAYVDFGEASIMQTLVANVPEIKRVQILIEGREVETLAGHVDLRRPLDTTWVTNQR